eukprot:7200125-Prymnesium_polylepis.1
MCARVRALRVYGARHADGARLCYGSTGRRTRTGRVYVKELARRGDVKGDRWLAGVVSDRARDGSTENGGPYGDMGRGYVAG